MSKKKARLGVPKLLLPESQSNDIENCLVFCQYVGSVIYQALIATPSHGYGRSSAESLLKTCQSNKSLLPYNNDTYIYTHAFMHFVHLGEWNPPENVVKLS